MPTRRVVLICVTAAFAVVTLSWCSIQHDEVLRQERAKDRQTVQKMHDDQEKASNSRLDRALKWLLR